MLLRRPGGVNFSVLCEENSLQPACVTTAIPAASHGIICSAKNDGRRGGLLAHFIFIRIYFSFPAGEFAARPSRSTTNSE
jgi:hypothetical protein